MNTYHMGTKCVQGGYTPGNGEPRQVPIIQSTTFKYNTSEDMGKLFDLEASGYFYTRLRSGKDRGDGRRNSCNVDFFRTGSEFLCYVQYL